MWETHMTRRPVDSRLGNLGEGESCAKSRPASHKESPADPKAKAATADCTGGNGALHPFLLVPVRDRRREEGRKGST